MGSIDYTCPIEGCDAARRSGSLLCGAHWGRLRHELRIELSTASRRLERCERAAAHGNWTIERQDRIDEAAAALIDAQGNAIADVEARETVLAAA